MQRDSQKPNKGKKVGNSEKEDEFLNIENYPKYESQRKLTSPRTLEVCRNEGIKPTELLYRPAEFFKETGKSEEVCKIRHDLINKKRLGKEIMYFAIELIEIIRQKRKILIQELEQRTCTTNIGISRYGSCPGLSYNNKSRVATSQYDKRSGDHNGPIEIEDVVSGDMLKAEETVQRAKERELFLMEKMLRNEEIKNIKLTEQDIRRKKQEAIKLGKNKEQLKKFKEIQETKKQEELKNDQERKKAEKKGRKEAEAKLHKDLEKKRKEKADELDKDRERNKIKKIIEIERRAKLEKAKNLQEDIREKQESKLIQMQVKANQSQLVVKRKHEMHKKVSEEKRTQRNLILEKVQLNVQIEEQKKHNNFEQRYLRREQKEQRLQREKDDLYKKLSEKGKERENKIQRTILKSNRQQTEKKIILSEKQRKEEERIIIQRKKKEEEELLKKETIKIKNEIKLQNAERKIRKEEYEVAKIHEKMAYNEERRLGFIRQRDALKDLRMKNQVYSEMQREGIRNTTYYMSVWNMWDMNVVRSVIGQPEILKHKSIEALIINKAANNAKQKRFYSQHGINDTRSIADSVPVTSRSGGRQMKLSSSQSEKKPRYNTRVQPVIPDIKKKRKGSKKSPRAPTLESKPIVESMNKQNKNRKISSNSKREEESDIKLIDEGNVDEKTINIEEGNGMDKEGLEKSISSISHHSQDNTIPDQTNIIDKQENISEDEETAYNKQDPRFVKGNQNNKTEGKEKAEELPEIENDYEKNSEKKSEEESYEDDFD